MDDANAWIYLKKKSNNHNWRIAVFRLNLLCLISTKNETCARAIAKWHLCSPLRLCSKIHKCTIYLSIHKRLNIISSHMIWQSIVCLSTLAFSIQLHSYQRPLFYFQHIASLRPPSIHIYITCHHFEHILHRFLLICTEKYSCACALVSIWRKRFDLKFILHAIFQNNSICLPYSNRYCFLNWKLAKYSSVTVRYLN